MEEAEAQLGLPQPSTELCHNSHTHPQAAAAVSEVKGQQAMEADTKRGETT